MYVCIYMYIVELYTLHITPAPLSLSLSTDHPPPSLSPSRLSMSSFLPNPVLHPQLRPPNQTKLIRETKLYRSRQKQGYTSSDGLSCAVFYAFHSLPSSRSCSLSSSDSRSLLLSTSLSLSLSLPLSLWFLTFTTSVSHVLSHGAIYM